MIQVSTYVVDTITQTQLVNNYIEGVSPSVKVIHNKLTYHPSSDTDPHSISQSVDTIYTELHFFASLCTEH